ncbi:MAG: L,D-transpeptidase family protein, partial [bacterium]
GAKIGAIFKSGLNTGEIAKIYTDSTDVQEDLITSRIMWLEGLEAGINKGRDIDSYDRRIYIHGTPEEGLIGVPVSHGCIRMRNKDVIELFDLVSKGTLVEIQK